MTSFLKKPQRDHPAYWAFLGHRLSGLALALFLPLHFLALGLALEGAATMDAALAYTETPIVKLAEWALVTLFALHLGFGVRLLVMEATPWRFLRDARLDWLKWIVGGSVAAGLLFLAVQLFPAGAS